MVWKRSSCGDTLLHNWTGQHFWGHLLKFSLYLICFLQKQNFNVICYFFDENILVFKSCHVSSGTIWILEKKIDEKPPAAYNFSSKL